MRWRVWLRLGRVSNVPTVWSNVLAGMVLAGAAPRPRDAVLLGLAASLFYTGGMFLNDAFDHDVDARERPERPIPAGEIGAAEVLGAGFGLLGAGILVVGWIAFGPGGRGDLAPLGAAFALGAAIVVYDAWHEENPLGPVIMGLCRALVYVVAGLAVAGSPGAGLVVGAVVLMAYVVGLTYFAKRWKLDGVVANLIAGISLLDAVMIALCGSWVAVIAALGFPATLLLQRRVRGT